ncbi:MAG: hypothetical protein P8R54_12480 [Myxococcota bacterium]|nr:hypothetical protein [Myxococcota bacterium]
MRMLLLTTALLAACDSKTEDGPDTSDTSDTSDTDSFVEGFGVGEVPPDFTLADAAGNLVSLSDFPEQRVMIVGTASW